MFEELKQALTKTGIPFAHHAWDVAPTGDYIVWAEDSARSAWAENKMDVQIMQGTIDLFTRSDSETPKETVQAELNKTNVSWYLNSIQYESDTRYIHYEWVFEVV